MEELGSHQPTIGPHQDDANLHQAESRGSQHNNSVAYPQQRGDHEGSMHTTHTSKSQSRGKSHVSHAKSERDMQREIDELKKKLRRVRRRHSSPNSEPPRRQMMLHIGEDPELRPVKLSLATRNIAISVRIRAQPIKTLGTMP